MHVDSYTINTPQDGITTSITIDEPTLTYHYHPESKEYTTVFM